MAQILQTSMLQKPNYTQSYNRMYSMWPRGPYVRLQVGDYPEILRLPQAFLVGSERNTLSFVQELAQHLVNERGHLSNIDQLGLNLDDAPPVGQTLHFTSVQADVPFTWTHGPDGRYRGRAPYQDEPFDDTASLRPSEISNMQNLLRWRIVARDTTCVVSGDGLEDSQAAHLAPKGREDIYDDILGDDFESPAYNTPYAILLATKLHRRFDRFQWSFYPQEASIVVHVFEGHQDLRPYHGLVIPDDRFHLSLRNYIEAPDKRLMAWHYKQCVLKYIRGFWTPRTNVAE